MTDIIISLSALHHWLFHHHIMMKHLTHWGWVTHICVDKLIIIASDNGLSPDQCQAIIWTNAGLLSIGSLRTYFNENLIKIQQFSLMKMHVKMSSAKWRPYCPGLNVLLWSLVTYASVKLETIDRIMALFWTDEKPPPAPILAQCYG